MGEHAVPFDHQGRCGRPGPRDLRTSCVRRHLEELTSLADGHIDLRENLAQQGRVPPVDPSNSLTRIGVGSTKLRPQSQSPAMAEVRRARAVTRGQASRFRSIKTTQTASRNHL